MCKGKPGTRTPPREFLLYKDANNSDTPEQPIWLEHPEYGKNVDVVAIPISSIHDDVDITSVNEIPETSDFMVQVAQDVFVLGYPKGIDGGKNFPIWKRASIATEPDLDYDEFPRFLIDTATREGMSGAPVIAYGNGTYPSSQGKYDFKW